MQIKNPILTGFHPDPSIIRVHNTYYIANSTFEWFPGVRLHQSTDLVHWTQVPSPLASTRLVNMIGDPASGGVWAPDLSYADGKFWLVYSDVKSVQGPFKDLQNYLTTAESIEGPWSNPVPLNSLGFDASLFHDQDGRKYLVQQTWDHREYRNSFNGITLTEFDPQSQRLLPETARTISTGDDVRLVEGPHLYRHNGYYYLFAAEGGTAFAHQEIVARSKTLDALSFVNQPDGPFITNIDSPDSYLQKQGHGELVDTPNGEWYYASLVSRPWHHANESTHDPRGWSSLGRETSIQKVIWDNSGWPRIVGGHNGTTMVDAPKGSLVTSNVPKQSQHDDFQAPVLSPDWNTLRQPFSPKLGTVGNGVLNLVGRQSLSSTFDVSLVARRWQAFEFDATTQLSFNPTSYQQMAGLVNFYNDRHYSWVFITRDEQRGPVIEVAQNDDNHYTSFLKDQAIRIPEGTNTVWFKTIVRTQTYQYQYSFNGTDWRTIPITLDAAILSDDYVMKNYGGFFTGAFVGLAAVDYAGYETSANFFKFDYTEL